MPKLLEDDLDAGYCPFCGVFVDGDFDSHWCPEYDEWEEDEDIDYNDNEEDEEKW